MKKSAWMLALIVWLAASVPPLTVVYPNGGEVLAPLAPVTIRWQGGGADPVVVVLFCDGLQRAVLAERAPNTGQFLWKVPGDLSSGGRYRIRIRSLADLSVNDFSDRDFAIHR